MGGPRRELSLAAQRQLEGSHARPPLLACAGWGVGPSQEPHRQPGYGRARADIRAHYQHSHSRRRPEGSSSSCRLCWRAHGVASQNHTTWAGSPWGGVLSGSFPGRSAPFHLPHTAAWSQIWGRQALGEPSHVGSPGLRWQHNHFDSRSHNALAPSVILVLGLGQTQRRKGHNLGLLLGRTSDACTGGA